MATINPAEMPGHEFSADQPQTPATRFIGPLLTETITTVDWPVVEELVSPSGLQDEERTYRERRLKTQALNIAPVLPGFASRLGEHLHLPGISSRPIAADQFRATRDLGGVPSSIIEKHGNKAVNDLAGKVALFADVIGTVESPKDAFLREVEAIHGVLGTNDINNNDPRSEPYEDPSAALTRLLSGAASMRKPEDVREDRRVRLWLEKHCPLIAAAVPLMPPYYARQLSRSSAIGAVAPEIIEGIEHFLEGHNRKPDPIARGPETFFRLIINIFKPRIPESIPDKVNSALNAVYSVLPSDGRRFKQEIDSVVRMVARSGPDALIRGLFKSSL